MQKFLYDATKYNTDLYYATKIDMRIRNLKLNVR